jgi:Na+-driven multidrug efflux pump
MSDSLSTAIPLILVMLVTAYFAFTYGREYERMARPERRQAIIFYAIVVSVTILIFLGHAIKESVRSWLPF